MGVSALLSAFVYVGPLDLTGQSDDLTLRCTAETRESTTWRNSGWRSHRNTLKTSEVNTGGFWSSDSANDLDPQFFNSLGINQVITAFRDETEGELAHIMRAMETEYAWLEGSVGDLAKVRMAAVGGDGAYGQIRGRLVKEYATVTATGATGTAVQLGAIGADQSLFGTFHTFGTPGTSITAIVESDDNASFTTPSTRGTFNGGAITTADGFWLTPVAGAITDDWWRINISAITGTWVIASALAVR